MKKLIFLLSFFVFGCSISIIDNNAHGPGGSAKINNINIGMTKEQVIAVMGSPISTSAMEGQEYLTYSLIESFGVERQYFVRLIDGKVEAYGRMGDFNSTKVPEHKTTIDMNIKNSAQQPATGK